MIVQEASERKALILDTLPENVTMVLNKEVLIVAMGISRISLTVNIFVVENAIEHDTALESMASLFKRL